MFNPPHHTRPVAKVVVLPKEELAQKRQNPANQLGNC